MQILNDIKTFIKEDEFKLTILNNRINVVNYTNVSHFETNEIKIFHASGEIKLIGTSLVITKLMNDELLIVGNIDRIELVKHE